MRIGIFDSGLGGLLILRAIQKALPEYDYVYLGDTKRLPYGNKSQKAVFEFTKEAVSYLFEKEDCAMVIIACNTASAEALGRIQREYIKKKFPNRRVIGVLIPTAEECASYKRVGVLATTGTVSSNTFVNKIKEIKKDIVVFQSPAPMLVPLAEEGEQILAIPFLRKYLKVFNNKNIDALVLGCTHYPLFKKEIRQIVGKDIEVISQDEIIPRKLKEYIDRQKIIKERLLRNSKKKRIIKILVTDMTKNIQVFSKKWFGKKTKIALVNL